MYKICIFQTKFGGGLDCNIKLKNVLYKLFLHLSMSDKLVKKCFKNSNFALLCDPFCSMVRPQLAASLRSGYQVKVNKKLSILFTEIGP